MLDVKVKPTKIRFGKYTFIVEVNLDGWFFPSRIFSVGFETETETETYEMETHKQNSLSRLFWLNLTNLKLIELI